MLVKLLLVLEVLIVNLAITQFICIPKYSKKVTFGVLGLFTLVVFTIIYYLELRDVSVIVFIGVGFFYYIPLIYLYQKSKLDILIVMVLSWINTMTVAGLSTEVGYRYFDNSDTHVLMVQTILFLLFSPILIKFFIQRFRVILEHEERRTKVLINSLFSSIFLIVVIQRSYLAYDNSTMYFGISIIVVIMFLLITELLYKFKLTSKRVSDLCEIAYTDKLTGVSNRRSLFIDTGKLINDKLPFTLVFFDLDNLKYINDHFGHSEGDVYIMKFVSIVVDVFPDTGKLYRLAGDEFVFILDDLNEVYDLDALEKKVINHESWKEEHEGVSIGMADFPDDSLTIDHLLAIADEKMYSNKNKKKKYR